MTKLDSAMREREIVRAFGDLRPPHARSDRDQSNGGFGRRANCGNGAHQEHRDRAFRARIRPALQHRPQDRFRLSSPFALHAYQDSTALIRTPAANSDILGKILP
ncbi:hypothetical protein HL653_12880 [Sphingomonas sp. AP4-R1]|uniref:hypothetical protein n=1 Tax=Sphingomonas sp. AP4-R1 TaxID=2735134 RepID=UPI0014936BC1|nr:hypothetical protein [Sphingomonas sp. AP4-R1]QJU58539.1 hypothetical protein HL653_12880 [Sphingomonas sp. AP4-R1]